MECEVLVVEDLDADRVLVLDALNAIGLGQETRCFRTGGEAMDYLAALETRHDEARVPLLLVLDLILPQVSGWEVLEWLEQRVWFAPMLRVVLSKLDDNASMQRAYGLGAHAFLCKGALQHNATTLTRIFHGYWLFAQRVGS